MNACTGGIEESEVDAVPRDGVSSWTVAPFERYLLADDRHQDPMVFPMVYWYRGEIDEASWSRAVEAAVERHPLLSCRLVGHGRRMRWRSGQRGPFETPAKGADTSSIPCRRIDPRRAPVFNWSVEPGEGGGKIRFLFHHTAVDGVGALQFLGDCFAIYDRTMFPESNVSLKDLQPGLLQRRSKIDGRTAPRNVSQPGQSQSALSPSEPVPGGAGGLWHEVQRFFLRKVTPIASESAEPQRLLERAGVQAVQTDDLFHLELSRDQSQRLRDYADTQNVTLNDVAMRDLFLALGRFNSRLGRIGQWYRLTMPVNLRDRRQRRMPACNQIGYAFIDRDMSSSVDPDSLLMGLAEENEWIRRYKLTAMFLDVLDQVVRVPGLMRVLTARRHQVATAVFSNLGDPARRFHSRLCHENSDLRAGGMKLVGFAAAPPVRPNMPASFLLSQFGGRVGLSVLISPRSLRPVDAEDLLGLWREQLLESRDQCLTVSR